MRGGGTVNNINFFLLSTFANTPTTVTLPLCLYIVMHSHKDMRHFHLSDILNKAVH